jgi:hypothetical protein
MWQFFQNNSLCSVSVQNPNEFTATVAPKPFEDQITLSHNYNTDAHEVHISRDFGVVKMKESSTEGGSFQTINTKDLPSGLYFLVVKSQVNLLTVKMIKY